MRQLSVPAPVRWAAVTVAAIAASTGCMSVGDDGGKPAPSRPAASKGAVTGPDGSTATGTGRSARTGGAEAHSDREAAESGAPSASADPSRSPGAKSAAPGLVRGGRLSAPPLPQAEPGVPEQPEPPAPSEAQTPEPPHPPEEPEPSEPPEVPSASPAAQLRNEAMGAPGQVEELPTPKASPQVGPA
ncbi:hypothetical protein OG892_21290 [Streptomyces sp. NBC_00341]|uniref:hypothetical protein n=1 Tax=unclassified Streptomyces TaxID=2593676 RepID=UPI0009399389|nr:hypothetical protein [Streptomyces sp. CB02488]OKK17104.1 hypothetical protein AMK09_21380 [Streptomyces sp. CB02488]WRZ13116.1 hypothetical protein OG892_21290 [Streptomyces sp. NBC_00341]